MFYAQQVLTRKGPLAKIWVAATFQARLTKAQVFTTDIASACRQIATPEMPMALRLTGCLLLGVCRIYQKQTGYVLEDASEALAKLQLAYHSGEARASAGTPLSAQAGSGVYTSASTTAHYGSVTFSENVIGAGPVAGEAARTGGAVSDEQRGASALLLMGDYWHGLLGLEAPTATTELVVGMLAEDTSAPETSGWTVTPQYCADAQRITMNTSFGDGAFGGAIPWAAEIVRQDVNTAGLLGAIPLAGTPTLATDFGERTSDSRVPTPERVRSVLPTMPEPPPLDLSLPNIQPAGGFPEANALDWSIASEAVPHTPTSRINRGEHSPSLAEQNDSRLNASMSDGRKRRKSAGRRALAPVFQLDSHLELPANMIRRALADTTDTLRRAAIEEPPIESESVLPVVDLVQTIVPLRGALLHPQLQACWSRSTEPLTFANKNQTPGENATETLHQSVPDRHSMQVAQDSFVLDDSQFSLGIPPAELSRLSGFSSGATPTHESISLSDSNKLERAMASPARAEPTLPPLTLQHPHSVPLTASTYRTEQMMSYLERKFQEEPHAPSLNMHRLWQAEAASRQVIVRSVLELLTLATQDRIVLQQRAPYADIEAMLPEHVSVPAV
jgi:hypothetical protein